MAAWAGFAWKFLVYLATAVLLHRVARAFYRKADFTATALSTLRAVPIVLLIGMIGYSIFTEVVAYGISQTYALENLEKESTFFSDQGVVTILFIAALFFIEGALRRGAHPARRHRRHYLALLPSNVEVRRDLGSSAPGQQASQRL